MQIISPKCSFSLLHNGLILRTSLQRNKIHSNMSCCIQKYVVHWSFIFWLFTFWQERNEGDKRGTILRSPNHCGGRRMTAEGAAKSQQYHKYFIQDSTSAFERSQVQTWGCQTCCLPRAPLNLVTPLLSGTCCQKLTVEWH